MESQVGPNLSFFLPSSQGVQHQAGPQQASPNLPSSFPPPQGGPH